MNAQLSAPARTLRSGGIELALYAASFWVFTYALLTARAEMLLGDGYDLIGARRLLATSAGALIFWAVLHWIDRRARGASSASFAAIIASVLPASLAVLAVRLTVDWMLYDSPPPLEANLRWVLVWSGYFGMWVSAALALQMQRACRSEAPSRAAAAPVREAPLPFDAWDWLIEEAARKMMAEPATTREALAAHLVAEAGYHCIDDLDQGARNARVTLAGSIAARLAEPC